MPAAPSCILTRVAPSSKNAPSILLAEALPDVGREQMLRDMTTWGYSYREGSVYAWLEGDAADAIAWLQQRGLIDAQRQRITHR